jgi:peptide/nickel transport system permease protein
MKIFNGSNRRRQVRKDYRKVRELKSKIIGLIPLFGLLPFWFLLCRIFESHALRLGIPLVLMTIFFVAILFFSIKAGRFMITLGSILIFPIFLSACLSFADFDFFSQRAIMTVFPKSLVPSTQFLFGTDYEGRDILATIVIGGMNAYLVATIATIIALLIGIPTGMLLTVKQGIVKGVASIVTQFFEIVPQLFFVLIVLGVFNFWAASSAGTRLVAAYAIPMAGFAIGISALPSVARIVESRVLQFRSKRFVTALQSSNVSSTKILWYNILWKNCISEIVVQATFLFGATILIESALGYAFEIGFGELGTGGYLSWGKILAEARRAVLFGENLWIIFFPILVTIMSILGVNIIGDSLVKFLRNES